MSAISRSLHPSPQALGTLGRPRRVLFAPETINIAEVTRSIEVARCMPADVECLFAGFSPRNREIIEDAGFELILGEPRLSDAQARQALDFDQGKSLRQPFTRSMLAGRVAFERDLIRRTGVGAVVIGVTPSQFISARAEGVPLVFVRPFAYSLPHLAAARRLHSTGFLPRTTAIERVIDSLSASALYAIGMHVPLPAAFYQVAREHGVSLPRSFAGGLTADLNLIATAPHLLPSSLELPSDHRVVGPVFARLSGQVPPVVARLAAGEEPVVYVAVGSSGNRELVLDLLRGLAGAPCQVVSPVRSYLSADDEATLPPNVHVTDWLPAHRLGDAIDLAITHGGEGTVQTSCVQGWPFIGIPLQFEQRFNVQRCVAFGSARLVSRRDVASTDWPALVRQALADRGMRARAQRMAALMAGLDGPGQAALAITQVLGG